ncbi:hypothetical protein EVA_09414 [gut metagenome]|uniref:Uncharacterized protein n=1 Tax=gut metagenome TaxID=749906 RepID=J9G6H5_9ZZZZ
MNRFQYFFPLPESRCCCLLMSSGPFVNCYLSVIDYFNQISYFSCLYYIGTK